MAPVTGQVGEWTLQDQEREEAAKKHLENAQHSCERNANQNHVDTSQCCGNKAEMAPSARVVRAAGSVCTGARGPASLESSLTVSYKIECLLTQRPGHKRPQQLCSLLPEAGKDQDACHQVNRQAGVAHPYPSAMHSTTDTNSPPAAWMEPTFALVCCPSAYRRFQRAFP